MSLEKNVCTKKWSKFLTNHNSLTDLKTKSFEKGQKFRTRHLWNSTTELMLIFISWIRKVWHRSDKVFPHLWRISFRKLCQDENSCFLWLRSLSNMTTVIFKHFIVSICNFWAHLFSKNGPKTSKFSFLVVSSRQEI